MTKKVSEMTPEEHELFLQKRREYRQKYLSNPENRRRMNEKKREWRQNNKDKVREYSRRYRQSHREQTNKTLNRYYHRNKEKIGEKTRARYAEDIEFKNSKLQASKKWRQKVGPEYMMKYMRQYRNNNEWYKQYEEQYRKNRVKASRKGIAEDMYRTLCDKLKEQNIFEGSSYVHLSYQFNTLKRYGIQYFIMLYINELIDIGLSQSANLNAEELCSRFQDLAQSIIELIVNIKCGGGEQ